MNNNQLTYTKDKKKILTKRHIIKIIIPLSLIIILISLIAFYTFVYKKPSNVLKRSLKDNNYICKKQYCHKNIHDYQYQINYKTGEAIITYGTKNFKIGLHSSSLYLKAKKQTCTYTSSHYSPTRLIDETYNIDFECNEYVPELNEIIQNYEDILDYAKVDIEDLSN